MDTAERESVYRIAGAAQYLGVCENSVRKLVYSGKLRAYRVGNAIRIPESWLREYRDSHHVAGCEQPGGTDLSGGAPA